MTDDQSWKEEGIEIYAMYWRLIALAVHRYGSAPSGQMLTVLTLLLLDRVDHHPTVGELAQITRLPKSTVSRYVSTEMSCGHLEEKIDPNDRRRRLLYPTSKAREEQRWHQGQVREIAEQTAVAISGNDSQSDSARRLIEVLMGFTKDEESNR